MVLTREMATGVADPGVLVQKMNHASGKLEWKVMPSDYDYSQELARASFADMLHDSERNDLYRVGLKAAIKKVRERGDKVRVLDIGTGTGLLSMMAAVEDVDSIVACEEFRPMAECAEKIIELNGFKDKIKLVRKRSTELTVGPGCDLEERANILVTEVFDTELIGEGAIGTYNHANRELLTADRLVVPGRARMFAQVVSSKLASDWNLLKDLSFEDRGSIKFSRPHTIDNLVLHDIQLSQLAEKDFTKISEPIQVFEFDLACKSGPIPSSDQSRMEFTALESGTVTAVFMWWDCFTDPQESVLLSCAPYWAHPDSKDQAWRDHWMQAVYFPDSEVQVERGDTLQLVSNHDEYSLWFNVIKSNQDVAPSIPVHLPMSRTRLFQVNDSEINQIYSRAISDKLSSAEVGSVLCVGDQSVMSLLAARMTSAQVTVVQENSHMNKILQSILQENGLADRVTFHRNFEDLGADKFDCVLSDVFYTGSVLPWHNLLYWYHINQLKQTSNITDTSIVLPGKFNLWLVPVNYKDLWKIRAPLHNIQGFDMKHFDLIIDKASTTCDENVEPQPLWEYPCTALAAPTNILTFNLAESIPEQNVAFSGDVDIQFHEQAMNGVAVWCTWDVTEDLSVNTGPVTQVVVGQQVDWSKGHKQGVHILKNQGNFNHLKYNIVFQPSEGDFKFEFTTS